MSDVVMSLRRLAFPDSTQAAVDYLASPAFQRKAEQALPGLKGHEDELAEELAAEFVFREMPGKLNLSKKVSAVHQLQVLEIVMAFYQQENCPDWAQHSLFKALFSGTLSPTRIDFLSKLVSLAIGIRNKAVLDCAAVWMQRYGCCTEVVSQVVTTVVSDYCHLVPGAASNLTILPTLSANFTCNFITALTAFYTPESCGRGKRTLPPELLDLLTEWVEQDPRLCLISLQSTFTQPHRSSLWTSPTKSNMLTPIPGLVRWTAQAPLYRRLASHQEGVSRTGSHVTPVPTSPAPTEMTQRERKTWSRLHLALLQTLLIFPTIPGANQLELLTLADMMRIVKDLSASIGKLKHLEAQAASYGGQHTEGLAGPLGGTAMDLIQTAIHRVVQVLQVGLTTGSFRCSLSDLQNICNHIPPNKLLSILQNQHLARTPPLMHHEGR